MDVTILGSGTAIPDKERGAPGLAVSIGRTLLFLDLGPGTLYRAARAGIAVNQVDYILLSHFHLDHTADLAPLLFAFHNPVYERHKDLTILGPAGLERFFSGLQGVYGDLILGKGYEQIFKTIETEPLACPGFYLKACPVVHGPAAIAWEITDDRGRRIVYSGDTEYSEALVALAHEVDLLILECAFPEGQGRPGHLTPSVAGRVAREAACKRLVLTHFYPDCRGQDLLTPCSRYYSGPITLAEDGLKLTV